MNIYLEAAGIFTVTAIVDAIWTMYNRAVTANKAFAAAAYSSGIVLAGGITVISYTENHWMILPAAAGAFVGTFFAVKKS